MKVFRFPSFTIHVNHWDNLSDWFVVQVDGAGLSLVIPSAECYVSSGIHLLPLYNRTLTAIGRVGRYVSTANISDSPSLVLYHAGIVCTLQATGCYRLACLLLAAIAVWLSSACNNPRRPSPMRLPFDWQTFSDTARLP